MNIFQKKRNLENAASVAATNKTQKIDGATNKAQKNDGAARKAQKSKMIILDKLLILRKNLSSFRVLALLEFVFAITSLSYNRV